MRKAPYILLFVLLVILIFIIGVRYGQRVEKTNKIIDYIVKLTPSVSPSPIKPQVKFATYVHRGCGMEFLYPAYLEEEKPATDAATLANEKSMALAFSCSKNLKKQFDSEEGRVATASLTFQNRTLLASKKSVEGTTRLFFTLTHPISGKNIDFILEENLYPLLERSLKFISPVLPTPPPPTNRYSVRLAIG